MKFLHKHTGNVDELFVEAIEEQVDKIQFSIDSTRELKDKLSAKLVDGKEFGSIIGNLYLLDLLNTSQLEIIKKEINEPSYEYGSPTNSLWTLFNHITHSLKIAHPSSYFETHINLVNYFKQFN